MSRVRIVNGVGVMLYSAQSGRSLYLLRAGRDSSWCLPGGKVERGESLVQALTRECSEEIGWWDHELKCYPVDCYTSPDGRFKYHTFVARVGAEFVPTLNSEHVAWAWCDHGVHPRPLHGGLHSTLIQDTVRQKIDIILGHSV